MKMKKEARPRRGGRFCQLARPRPPADDYQIVDRRVIRMGFRLIRITNIAGRGAQGGGIRTQRLRPTVGARTASTRNSRKTNKGSRNTDGIPFLEREMEDTVGPPKEAKTADRLPAHHASAKAGADPAGDETEDEGTGEFGSIRTRTPQDATQDVNCFLKTDRMIWLFTVKLWPIGKTPYNGCTVFETSRTIESGRGSRNAPSSHWSGRKTRMTREREDGITTSPLKLKPDTRASSGHLSKSSPRMTYENTTTCC